MLLSYLMQMRCAPYKKVPVIILFVGMMVDQYEGAVGLFSHFILILLSKLNMPTEQEVCANYAGTLTIRNTTSTRWCVNVDIPKIMVGLESYARNSSNLRSNSFTVSPVYHISRVTVTYD
jgi:hypothetical protein